MCSEWGLTNKLFSLTLDNASGNDASINLDGNTTKHEKSYCGSRWVKGHWSCKP